MPSKLFSSHCGIHGAVKHRAKNDGRLSCTQCEISTLNTFRRKRKRKLIEMAGGACIRCGYRRCDEALEFHHRKPFEKAFELSLAGMTKSWSLILAEFAKCDLLCRNCHAEVHAEMARRVTESTEPRTA